MASAATAGPMPPRVFAVAAPAGAAGLFEPGRLVTAATVAELRCEEEDVVRAAAALAETGFEVLQTTSLMINLAGPPRLFEETFGVRLYTEEREVIKPGAAAGLATFVDCVDSQIPGLVPTVDSALAEVLAGVAIEQPYYPASVPPPAPAPAEPPEVDYWHLRLPEQLATALRADGAHADGAAGAGVRVAMVDTGFEQHPFFAAHGYRVEPTVLGPGTAEPQVDENGHGTGESANVFAAAPSATLLPVKTATASGALVNVTAAFNAAVALGPHVLTNSWGSSQPEPPLSAANQALAAAVAAAVAEGIVVVFSAGNGGWGFPGQHPDVVCAGGVYQDPEGNLRASDYASGFVSRVYPGRRVPDLSGLVGLLPRAMYLMLPVPPGCVIDREHAGGTHPDGDQTAPDDGWAAFSGTSAAAPQLAGVCALLLEAAPDLEPERVRELLMTTARDVTTGTNHPTFGHEADDGPDLATGHGLVDAAAAVAAAHRPSGTPPAVGDGDGAPADGDGPPVVALVVLRPRTGTDPPAAPSTAADAQWLPARQAVTAVSQVLTRAGFRVGPAVGPTMAVEGPAELFGRVLGAEPLPAPDHGWTSTHGDALPLDRLPAELRGLVHAVVLERPADLHPEP